VLKRDDQVEGIITSPFLWIMMIYRSPIIHCTKREREREREPNNFYVNASFSLSPRNDKSEMPQQVNIQIATLLGFSKNSALALV
jgi:hypothetical protein